VRDVGEVISWCHNQACRLLLRLGGNIVNDVASLCLHVVGLEVSHRRDVGVSGLAVVTLVVIVGEDLPIVVPVHLPGVIKDIVIKVEVFIFLLGIGTLKVLLPRDIWGFFGVKVDPDETILVNVGVNTQQPVLGFVETLKLLVARSLCEVAAEAIRPAVVSVCEAVSLEFSREVLLKRLSLACEGNSDLLTCRRKSWRYPSPLRRWDRHGACRCCGRH
jgi:hypothetical protein